MAHEGYVERLRCDEDGRGQVIRITGSGRTLMRKIWPVYNTAIAKHFAAPLSDSEIKLLSTVLTKLIDNSIG